MNRLLVLVMSAIAIIAGGTAANGVDTRPNFEKVACSNTRTTNCFYDATQSKQGGHSFYRVKVGTKNCTLYWDNDFARKNNFCKVI